MNSQMLDIWGYLAQFIKSNADKCHLMMTCKKMSKCKFHYDGMISLMKIVNLKCYKKFTNVIIDTDHSLIGLSPSIDTITFDNNFNKPIECAIPTTIRHITFGKSFQKSLKDCIPSSVISLTLNAYYTHFDKFPTTIKELFIYEYANVATKKDIIKNVERKDLKIYFL